MLQKRDSIEVATSTRNLGSNKSIIHASLVRSLDESFKVDSSSTSEFIDVVQDINGNVSQESFTLIGENDKLLTRDLFTLKARFPHIQIKQATLFPNTNITPNARPRKLI